MLIMDLLRHGALEGGIKYRGQTDDPLTPEGRACMDKTWQQLAGEVDAIFTSPLSRCAGPASQWAEEAGIECIVDSRLSEMYYGAWEGKTKQEVECAFPGVLQQWRKNPAGMRPAGGESPEELRKRIQAWWLETKAQFDGKHILVVAHSGTLRMLIALLLNQPISYTRSIDMPYACLNRIAWQADDCTLSQPDIPSA